MKRYRLTPVFAATFVFLLVVCGGVLTGCFAPQVSNNDEALDEVLERLDEMQAQIDALEANQNDGESNSSTDDTSATDDTTDTQSETSSDASSMSDFEAQLEDLSARVDEAVATAAAVEVPTNAADRPQAYFDAKAPLEKLENELDSIDDAIELAYRQGLLTQSEVWALEVQEDAIEDALDQAEDDLEIRMGVDD